MLPNLPPDLELVSLSQIFGEDRIVEEFVVGFTHTLKMDWMIPGVPATGRKAEFVLVGVIGFQGGKWPASIYFGIRQLYFISWESWTNQQRQPVLEARRNSSNGRLNGKSLKGERRNCFAQHHTRNLLGTSKDVRFQ
jgi:hypothetical protein